MTDATEQSQQPKVPVLGGLVAYLTVDGAMKAAEFYKRAFGAEQVFMYPADEQGRTMHIHLYINGSSLMLCDAYPEHGHALQKPQAFTLQLLVDDIDAWWKRAVDAGAEVLMPIEVMFWGDRWGQLRDPFGIVWAMNAPVKK
ncbi:glyoxalase/bleomycin resistance/extradiol dioxygenase family protein (plasmid) [Rhizobium sp. CB3171]|uniref:VOC family protein n=1 Tax=Rhizobium sp. CB3171 TaxID=3039157 RepID=UPI0024B0B53A|nr:glyoxalase/bleomycin resistance/extradiol dioxygenase family protein [Rhizobium sp. CB3171]WFU06201.1 glyoxalase/bleomycin resistance/extradiol dioxygenase family protein [Rhizobium sp. CB3171]